MSIESHGRNESRYINVQIKIFGRKIGEIEHIEIEQTHTHQQIYNHIIYENEQNKPKLKKKWNE